MLVNLQTNNKAAAHNQCSNVIGVIDEKPNNVLIKAFRRQIKLFTDEFLVNDQFLLLAYILWSYANFAKRSFLPNPTLL